MPSALLLLLVCLVGTASQERLLTPESFRASDAAMKRRILNDVAAARTRAPIEQVIQIVQAGFHDAAPEVRIASLAAVAGRANAARWAGTEGPPVGPAPPGVPPPPRIRFPVEWKEDQQKLRASVYDDCVRLLRTDADPNVRRYAQLAVVNVERPARPDEPFSDSFVDLQLELYRKDSDAQVRAEIVKTLRLIPNRSADITDVLRDALVDPQEAVRHEALSAITTQGVGGPVKLRFEDARETILRATQDERATIRLAAVRALNVFGVEARAELPLLQRMQQSDPDPQVRESARLAIDAIRRAGGVPEIG